MRLVKLGGRNVLVTSSLPSDLVDAAMKSVPFVTWVANTNRMKMQEGSNLSDMDVTEVEIQSVDKFGSSGRVGFIKLKAECSIGGTTIPGICFLRGMGVGVLVEVNCSETNENYFIMVEQARIPVGQTKMLEIPAGMIDDSGNFAGTAAKELEEECGIHVQEKDLLDLTDMAYGGRFPGICPSPGGCDEFIRLIYYNYEVSKDHLHQIEGRLGGLRDEGELISLRLIKAKDLWKQTCDAKALCALYILDRLRETNSLPNKMQTAQRSEPQQHVDPSIAVLEGKKIPQLAFGLYKVDQDDCVNVMHAALQAGYRHFDSAAIYGNEEAVGRALAISGVPRKELFIASKVWNDCQKSGRAAVRQSVEDTLRNLQCDYVDLFFVHWPVPGCHTETYKELELLCQEGKIRSLGLSNYAPKDYEDLLRSGISVQPVVNQIEVSPLMYRPDTIEYFQRRGIVIAASKALNRGGALQLETVCKLADKYNVTSASILIRWAVQKNLVVITKSSNPGRMVNNRDVFQFSISADDMSLLDDMTTKEAIEEREVVEASRKTSQ